MMIRRQEEEKDADDIVGTHDAMAMYHQLKD
jgi:hypothetical protein